MVPQDTFTGLVEGPVCDAEGTLFAMGYGELTDGSNASGQFVALLTMLGLWEGSFALGRVSADGTHGTFVDVPAGGMANGLRFDRQGQLFVADVTGHNVLRLDPISKAISVFAHEPRMNQPNDLAITDADVLFASDPNWSEGTGQLWRIDPDGTVHLMETEMGTTNGIEVGPDGGTLYVGESAQRWIWQYDLSADGQLSNKRLLITFEDFGLDGMRCDEMGNLYVTRYGKGQSLSSPPAANCWMRSPSRERTRPTSPSEEPTAGLATSQCPTEDVSKPSGHPMPAGVGP